MLVEVCANSLQSAVNAEQGGATRIELCTELAVGGITPSYGMLQSIRAHISIPVHVLIRPRSGDFTYSRMEFEIMKNDVRQCLEMGFEGVVSGVLHQDFTLDEERTGELLALAKDCHFTFHRAFDWVKDPFITFEKLNALGVDSVLTSGQKKSALEGIGLLSQLQEKTTETTVMPGGGISPDNVNEFKNRGFKVVHLSGSVPIRSLENPHPIPMSSPSDLRDDLLTVTDLKTIRMVMERLK